MTYTQKRSLFTIFAFSSLFFTNVIQAQAENDTIPPTRPFSLLIFNVTQTSVELEWSTSTDNVGVVSYTIYLGNAIISSTDEFTFSTTVTGLTPYTYYSFAVSSSDAAGNESDLRYNWFLTDPICGVTNNWVGSSSRWANDPLNWSEGVIAFECHDVLIDNGASVTAANDVHPSSIFNREYLVSTFEVGLGSGFSVDPGAEFHVIPSKPGPYVISGNYEDPMPDCIDPLFCACCHNLGIVDDVNCWYIYQGDLFQTGTYSINGNILTVNLDKAGLNPPYNPTYRIIDNNTLVELYTADVLTKL